MNNLPFSTDAIKGKVIAVCKSPGHTMRKPQQDSINLIENFGVEGDAHGGATVMHVYDRKKNSEAPNLRQVHIIQQELHDELAEKGFNLQPGQMGENITSRGIDVINLPENTILHLGKEAQIQVKGLRAPCSQLDGIQKGLMKATIGRDLDDKPVFKSGIMCTVLKGGVVNANDEIRIEYPPKPYQRLKNV